MKMSGEYFQYAQGALAAYASALNNIPESSNASRYEAAGLSTKQAQRFDSTWLVLSQSTPTPDGFSAVLPQNRESGEKVLAIRGTEASFGGVDYITDLIDIGVLGHVHHMAQYQSLERYYAELVSGGLVEAGEQLTVTGHSLGGFLAQAFLAQHDSVVRAAYTFNAPGFRGAAGQLLEFLGVTAVSAPHAETPCAALPIRSRQPRHSATRRRCSTGHRIARRRVIPKVDLTLHTASRHLRFTQVDSL